MKRLLLLASVVLLAGCAQTLPASERAALDRAADVLDAQLAPAGQLAAAAALFAERTGTFPESPFELLGDPAAAETGARQVNFSAMELLPDVDGLRITYTLLPTREDPSRRTGDLRLAPPDGQQVEARVLLTRAGDPDHDGRTLDLHRDGNVAVRQLGGRFCVDLGATPTPEAPARPYTVTFTPSPGTAGNAFREVAEGYTVTVTR